MKCERCGLPTNICFCPKEIKHDYMLAIVTVRTRQVKEHKEKIEGLCPIDGDHYCSDIEGEHHSFIIKAESKKQIVDTMKGLGYHITRIEIVNPKWLIKVSNVT